MAHADRERVHLETLGEWHAWLAANHATSDGVWLVSWRSATGRPRIAYEDAVEEALCFGWIDSTARTIDAERGMQWFAPRRRGSAWARSNKERAARLEAAGRMTEAGRRAIEAAQADGSWTKLDSVEAMVVPDDLAAALAGTAGLRDRWEALIPSLRRQLLFRIVDARTPGTRARRVAEAVDAAEVGGPTR